MIEAGDLTFRCMGTDVRVIVEAAGADEAIADTRAFLEDFDRRLSRFRAGSELSALNADPRACVPASELLRGLVRAAVWAAQRTGGLVDPTLLEPIERAGYASSREGVAPEPLGPALAAAPRRRAAAADPAAPWRLIEVDDRTGTITRPPGLRLDSGGIGKGLAADVAAVRLRGAERFVVDCGGDIAVGGTIPRPRVIEIAHPLTGESAETVNVARGGVATSGIDARVWRHGDAYAHHLLDPSTGAPAWTGLIAATALAPTALEAETLAKAALLSGPEDGRAWLATHGGLLFGEDGGVERVGSLPAAGRRLSVRIPEVAA